MPLTPTPLLATSLKAVTRSLLLSLGMDHALIDFLIHTAVGAATVLFAILFVGIRVPRRRSASSLPASLRRFPQLKKLPNRLFSQPSDICPQSRSSRLPPI